MGLLPADVIAALAGVFRETQAVIDSSDREIE
jgi:hypothetical protein